MIPRVIPECLRGEFLAIRRHTNLQLLYLLANSGSAGKWSLKPNWFNYESNNN